MECTRCDGLMIADNLIDIQESSVPMWMKGWRCVSCGNIVDPLILRHRISKRREPRGYSEQKRPGRGSVTRSKRRPNSGLAVGWPGDVNEHRPLAAQDLFNRVSVLPPSFLMAHASCSIGVQS